jgi:hypothetical protein
MNHLLLMTLSTIAAPADIVITNLPDEPGTYYLMIVRSTSGEFTASLLPSVTLGTVSTPPTPEPDPTHAVLRKAVSDATKAVTDPNKANAQRTIATMYSSISGLPFQTRNALQKSTDLMWNALGLGPSWAKWKTTVDEALAAFTLLDEAIVAWRVVAEVVK